MKLGKLVPGPILKSFSNGAEMTSQRHNGSTAGTVCVVIVAAHNGNTGRVLRLQSKLER